MVILNACPPTDTTTPPARLDAADARLNAMQQAVYLVSTALGNFYATLSDEQKAKFEAIGKSERRSFVNCHGADLGPTLTALPAAYLGGDNVRQRALTSR